ncbi:hypothetical protein TSOC_008225, partial [Tetrabaena socialis]
MPSREQGLRGLSAARVAAPHGAAAAHKHKEEKQGSKRRHGEAAAGPAALTQPSEGLAAALGDAQQPVGLGLAGAWPAQVKQEEEQRQQQPQKRRRIGEGREAQAAREAQRAQQQAGAQPGQQPPSHAPTVELSGGLQLGAAEGVRAPSEVTQRIPSSATSSGQALPPGTAAGSMARHAGGQPLTEDGERTGPGAGGSAAAAATTSAPAAAALAAPAGPPPCAFTAQRTALGVSLPDAVARALFPQLRGVPAFNTTLRVTLHSARSPGRGCDATLRGFCGCNWRLSFDMDTAVALGLRHGSSGLQDAGGGRWGSGGTNEMKRHFAELTTAFLSPFARYFEPGADGRVPGWNSEEFLFGLRSGVAGGLPQPLLDRVGNPAAAVELYARFTACLNFAAWFAARRRHVAHLIAPWPWTGGAAGAGAGGPGDAPAGEGVEGALASWFTSAAK